MNASEELTNLLNSALNPSTYDRRFYSTRKTPLTIAISIFLHVVGPINERDDELHVDLSISQAWEDTRLAFNNSQRMYLAPSFLDDIWIPDTYFESEKTSVLHKATVDNAAAWIEPDGRVKMWQRFTIVSYCKMDVTYFPLDRQICEMKLGSYAYPSETVQYCWEGSSDDRALNTEFVEPKLALFELSNTSIHRFYFRIKDIQGTVDYWWLSVRFTFDRIPDFYVQQIYAPVCLIAVVPWAAFYMGRDTGSNLKLTLTVTVVLTMSTFMVGATNHMPKVSYLKAIDIYISFCFLMVIAALAVSTFVNVLIRRERKRGKSKCFECRGWKLTASRVEKMARITFPVVLLIFNVIYICCHIKLSQGYNFKVLRKYQLFNESYPFCQE